MVHHSYRSDIIIGTWKFSASVPLAKVLALAEELSGQSTYRLIYIRKLGPDGELGLHFVYVTQDAQSDFNSFIQTNSAILTERFGSGFVASDVSGGPYVIKYAGI